MNLTRVWSITCVDNWAPYIDTNVNNGYEHIVMTAALEKDAAYELFLHNCRSCRIDHVIKIKRGNSKTVLPELIGNQYDIIYLDGDHSFEMVLRYRHIEGSHRRGRNTLWR